MKPHGPKPDALPDCATLRGFVPYGLQAICARVKTKKNGTNGILRHYAEPKVPRESPQVFSWCSYHAISFLLLPFPMVRYRYQIRAMNKAWRRFCEYGEDDGSL